MRLAWVSAQAARGTDPDEPLVLAALHRLGADVDVVDWHDTSIAWASYDRAVLRSPWDYQSRLPEFLEWLERVDQLVEVRNPADAVRWSLDKHYLGELAAAGVPVIETRFVEPGEALLPDTDEGTPCVIKPSVGAGASDVAIFGPGDHAAAAAHVAMLHARGLTALVQPLVPSVSRVGEWPMVFFDGEFSHSANKFVRLPGADEEVLFAPENNRPHTADTEQVRAASRAIDVVQQRFGTLTYARVDLVRDENGRYLVLEVEIFEPSLFLPEGGDAAVDRCARALINP